MTPPDTIKIECVCGWTAHVQAALAGKHLRCRECHGVILAPEFSVQKSDEGGDFAGPSVRRTSSSKKTSARPKRKLEQQASREPRVVRQTKDSRRRRPESKAVAPRSVSRVPQKTHDEDDFGLDDDYGAAYAEPDFLRSATSSKNGKRRRKSSRGGGVSTGLISLLVVVFVVVALAFGGYALIRSDAFARIAGQEFRAVQPIYATSESMTMCKIRSVVRPKGIGAKSLGTEFDVLRDSKADTITLTLERLEIGQYDGRSPLSSVVFPTKAVEMRSGEVVVKTGWRRQSVGSEAVPAEVGRIFEFLGRPILTLPRSSAGFQAPRALVSDAKLTSKVLDLMNFSMLIDAPLATNVQWWGVEQTWHLKGGQSLSGTVRYEKTKFEGDRVKVSVSGELISSGPVTNNGMKFVGCRGVISGTQNFSIATSDWVGGWLTFVYTGRPADGSSTESVSLETSVQFHIDPLEVVSSGEFGESALSR